jgi:hypothetical protein
MSIDFCNFNLDAYKVKVAPVIYGEKPHLTTGMGVNISPDLYLELCAFLRSFNKFVGVEKIPYYRIDAYFDEKSLWILEINASFVDGWGIALNLSRAAGIYVDRIRLDFPKRFKTTNAVYFPELSLFVDELKVRGISDTEIVDNTEKDQELTYVYGRVGSKDKPYIFPYDGLRLDNKLNLGLFSRDWDGTIVKVPKHYIERFEDWEKIPKEVVLKFCDKGSEECKRAKQSVLFNKPAGKSPFLKRCYKEEILLAQEIIEPKRYNGENCQLIILAVENAPVTGYVQYSRENIINDNSIHGPLCFELPTYLQ